MYGIVLISMLDAISETRLSGVLPLLARKARQMSDIVSFDRPAITFRITQAFRSWTDQALLYAKGRTTPGPKVTDAAPGHSYHQFGLAIDIVPFGYGGKPDWDQTHPVWRRLENCGISLGLVAGAEFRTFPDAPHFQLTGLLPVSPDDHVRELFQAGGVLAVWKAAFPDDIVATD